MRIGWEIANTVSEAPTYMWRPGGMPQIICLYTGRLLQQYNLHRFRDINQALNMAFAGQSAGPGI